MRHTIFFGLSALLLQACGGADLIDEASKQLLAKPDTVLKTQSPSERKYAAGELIPIRSGNYKRFILLEKAPENYVEEKICSYPSEKGAKYNVGIAKQGNWTIIKFDEQLSFSTYHNLVTWFMGIQGEDKAIPKTILGLAIHKSHSQDSYLQMNDTLNHWGDTNIGFFEDGRQFFIYLPDAYEEEGNLKLLKEKLMESTTIQQYLGKLGAPSLEGLSFESRILTVK